MEEEVLDNYLIWELCKQKDIQRKIINKTADDEELKQEILRQVRQLYHEKSYSYEEKIDQVRRISSNPEHKAKMFRYCSWRKQKVKIEDLGTTLPHAMSLPPEVITNSLPKVVKFVKNTDPEKYPSIKYINSLKEFPDILNQFPPTVIHPGKIIRRKDRMKKAHGDKEWEIQETWGGIHDANHRTIAKILANDLEEIKCYVGHPKTEKIYEHVKIKK